MVLTGAKHAIHDDATPQHAHSVPTSAHLNRDNHTEIHHTNRYSHQIKHYHVAYRHVTFKGGHT